MVAKVEHITVICHWCNKPHERLPSWLATVKTGRFFCCNECKRAWETRDRKAVHCHGCGIGFTVTPSKFRLNKHFFCSMKCRDLSVDVTCHHCGKTIERKAHSIRKSNSGRFFCSRECKWAWGKTTKTTVERKECGKVFERYKHHADRHEHQFCGMNCMGIWGGRQRRGENHPQWRADKKTVGCDTCGNVFTKSDSQFARDKHHFCSNTCYAKWKATNMAGELNPAWKGGVSRYYGPNWNRQARAARKRDGYKCRHCGKAQKKKGRALDVHHITPFRTFDYIYGENDFYIQANDLNNLISLCQHCHKKAEWQQIPIQPTLISI